MIPIFPAAAKFTFKVTFHAFKNANKINGPEIFFSWRKFIAIDSKAKRINITRCYLSS